jgi:hypothetical protein
LAARPAFGDAGIADCKAAQHTLIEQGDGTGGIPTVQVLHISPDDDLEDRAATAWLARLRPGCPPGLHGVTIFSGARRQPPATPTEPADRRTKHASQRRTRVAPKAPGTSVATDDHGTVSILR